MTMDLCGVSLLAKRSGPEVLPCTGKRSARSITNQTCSQLAAHITLASSKLKVHGWWTVGLITIGAGMIYGCLQLYPDYLWYAGGIAASSIMINAYLSLEHYYNYLRYCNALRATNHDLNVTRALTAAKLELSAFRIQDMWDWTSRDVHTLLYDRLTARKQIWMIKAHTTITGETCTVIYNGFYEHLYFVFMHDPSAQEFMDRLNELTANQVTDLAQSPDDASRLQTEFLQTRIHTQMFRHYYEALR